MSSLTSEILTILIFDYFYFSVVNSMPWIYHCSIITWISGFYLHSYLIVLKIFGFKYPYFLRSLKCFYSFVFWLLVSLRYLSTLYRKEPKESIRSSKPKKSKYYKLKSMSFACHWSVQYRFYGYFCKKEKQRQVTLAF